MGGLQRMSLNRDSVPGGRTAAANRAQRQDGS